MDLESAEREVRSSFGLEFADFSTPSTAVPPTPSGASGWMEDIKKVISFESVEEFWG
ncbi:11918_t:CDS:2, partial [Acaulospora colombiana]